MPQHLPWEDWRPGEEEHTSGWVRATAPSGDASFEGRVGWSGDLGFGVRPGEGDQASRDARRRAAVAADAHGDHGDHDGHGDHDDHGGGH